MTKTDSPVHLGLPKGRMHDSIVSLLTEAGISLRKTSRGYRPAISIDGFEVKILKPQNIVTMLAAGTRDIGFAGADWVAELAPEIASRDHELVALLDTGLDHVRIVAAAPRELVIESDLPRPRPGQPLRVAGEMERLSTDWIAKRGIDARFVRTYGATEVFPPEDADVIVDVTQTGATLEANGLVIIDQLMTSSTRLFASSRALEDTTKRQRIEDFVTICKSVLEARGRAILDVNVPEESLSAVIDVLPCMRVPTVSRLHEGGYAVRVAAPRKELHKLIPAIKAKGGSDIIVSPIQQVVP